MWLFILLFVTILFVFLINTKFRKQPPGPTGLPIIGYFPFLVSNPVLKIQKLSEKYGEVMKLNLLGQDYYFLNTYEVLNEALKKQGQLFSGRPFNEFHLNGSLLGKRSLVNCEGDLWRIQQKFYVSKLSGLGMGKSVYGDRIHEVCDDLIENIKKAEEITNLFEYLSNFSSNIITYLLFSKKYSINDENYKRLIDSASYLTQEGEDLHFIITGPLVYLLFKLNRKYWRLGEGRKRLYEAVYSLVKDRFENDCDGDFNDVLDCCLKERNGENRDLFDTKNILTHILLLSGAGTDTVASALNFIIYFMATHPEIQAKVFEEIEDTFGKECRVLVTDREKLNYTRAVIAEAQRFASITPLGIFHVNKEATNIGGYHIPKRSKIITNLYQCSRDKRHFKNTDVFDVNNFLDENGKFAANAAHIPFGVGYRKCLGQQLAESAIFIVFTRLIQQFEWMPPKDGQMKYEVIEGIVRFLAPFKIIAKLRK